MPTILDLPLLELPWTETTAPLANAWSMLQDQRVAATVAAVLAAPILYFLSQIVVTGIAQARVESARTELNAASQSVRNDRAAALENLSAIDAYLSLQAYPTQFEIVAKATQLMKDKNVTIAEWNYDNGNLDMTLRGMTVLDASSFIEMFERDGLFSDVSATTSDQGRELRLKTHVKRSMAGVS